MVLTNMPKLHNYLDGDTTPAVAGQTLLNITLKYPQSANDITGC